MTNNQEKNQALLQSILEEGETVEWQGFSAQYPIVSDESKKGLIIRWGICAVCIILWAVYCIIFRHADGASGFALVISMILVVVFFLYMALIPLMDRKKIVEKNSYFLTNRRAILIDDGEHAYSMNLYGVKADFLPAEEGNTTLLLRNNADRKIPSSLRAIAWKPLTDEYGEGTVTDLVFYNVKKDKALTDPFH